MKEVLEKRSKGIVQHWPVPDPDHRKANEQTRCSHRMTRDLAETIQGSLSLFQDALKLGSSSQWIGSVWVSGCGGMTEANLSLEESHSVNSLSKLLQKPYALLLHRDRSS